MSWKDLQGNKLFHFSLQSQSQKLTLSLNSICTRGALLAISFLYGVQRFSVIKRLMNLSVEGPVGVQKGSERTQCLPAFSIHLQPA